MKSKKKFRNIFWRIFWSLALILTAVLIILDALNVTLPFVTAFGEVSLLALVLGFLLIATVINFLIHGLIGEIFFPLAALFMIFEKNIATACGLSDPDIINNWLVVLIAILLGVGVGLLFPRKRRKGHRNESFGGSAEYTVNGQRASSGFGESTIYIDSAQMIPNEIENGFGECRVYFENIESYKGDCELYVKNSFGELRIFVPSAWCIKTDISNGIGAVNVPSSYTDGPILTIRGKNNFGEIRIDRV